MDLNYIKEQAKSLQGFMVQSRRHLHRNPELSFREFKTQEYIGEFLKREGISWKKSADTGIVALIPGAEPGKVVALRGDIDALPMPELNDFEYASENEGIMHACGHDAHTAIAMGAAKFFNDNRGKFSGAVKIFFQPAEENDGGAVRMIEGGCMESPKVDYVLGLHVNTAHPYDHVEYRYGAINAATDTAFIRFTGRGGHGAYPENCVDPIVMAASFVTAAQSIVSRNLAAGDAAVFTVSMFHGGTAQNIIADYVDLTGTIRTLKPSVRDFVAKRIAELADGIAKSFGGTAETKIKNGYMPLISHDDIMDVVVEAGNEYLGKDHMHEKEFSSMGGEDFGYFIEHTPGAYYGLGCLRTDKKPYLLHSGDFDIDERCLETGLVMQAYAALKLLNRK